MNDILDYDISSMYPNIMSLDTILTRNPYRYYIMDDMRYVIGNAEVNEWITNFLPDVIEVQGSLILNESEFMMLVLKFGPGKESIAI